jgi:hypothetical protein
MLVPFQYTRDVIMDDFFLHHVTTLSHSYKRNLVLKKSKFVLN